MGEKKISKGIIWLIVILIIIILGLVGYIVYDKVLKDDKQNINENYNENNSNGNQDVTFDNSYNDSIEEDNKIINDVQGTAETDGKIVYDYNKTRNWNNALIVDKDDFKVEVKNTEFDSYTGEPKQEYQAVYINDKIVINEEKILSMSSIVSIDSFVVFPNGDIIVEYGEDVEGLSSIHFFIYNNGNDYIILDEFVKFNEIDVLKIEDNIWTFSTSGYFMIDDCERYKNSEIVYAKETFEYLGNGKFNFLETIEEKTAADIRKEKGYSSCSH